MNWISRLHLCWKDLISRKQREVDLDDELKFHLEMQEQQNYLTGMNDLEARRSAAIDLGGIEQIKEDMRAQRSDSGLKHY